MALLHLATLPWTAVAGLDRGRTVVALPIGAIEAHGPHLPLAADVVIAEGMVAAAARALAADRLDVLALPALTYSPSGFAAGFPGTLGSTPATAAALLGEIAAGLARHGFRSLLIANSHFDPANVAALRCAVADLGSGPGNGADLDDTSIAALARLAVVFPDLTRRALAGRLTEEFQSGACHGGRYETSLILALRPELVDTVAATRLPALPISLVTAIRGGSTSFEDAGIEAAYCGDPASASAEEGRAILETLGTLCAEAVRAARAGADAAAPSVIS